jgi:hypothetical protein
MPRLKWSLSKTEPDDLEPFDVYDGDPIANGVYDGVVTRLTMKENSNGDDMITGLWICKDSRGDKKKYAGAPVWFQQNLTEQGERFVKALFKAMGIPWSDLTNKTILESDDRPTKIKSVGRVKFNDGAEVPMRVQIGRSKATPEYPSKPEIKQYLPPRDEEDAWDEDEPETDTGEEDPFA